MQIITSIIAGIAGGIAGVAFSSLSTRLRAHRQEESSVLLLSVEVVQNLAASTAMNKQVRDPQRTDWDPKEADPGSFKHAVWDAELPHIINALAHNPQTFAAVMNAYMTLSAEPRMRLPEGQTHGAQRYQWGGWITPQIEYMPYGQNIRHIISLYLGNSDEPEKTRFSHFQPAYAGSESISPRCPVVL